MDNPFSDDFSTGGGGSTVVEPKKAVSLEQEASQVPRFHVLLWDSDDHTFEYVHQMLREIFGHTKGQCQKIAESVDEEGRAIVLTTTQEHAELKRDQIHAYGKDHHAGTKGSMWATIEKA